MKRAIIRHRRELGALIALWLVQSALPSLRLGWTVVVATASMTLFMIAVESGSTIRSLEKERDELLQQLAIHQAVGPEERV